MGKQLVGVYDLGAGTRQSGFVVVLWAEVEGHEYEGFVVTYFMKPISMTHDSRRSSARRHAQPTW